MSERVKHWAAARPDAVAVSDADERLSWRALDARVDDVARTLGRGERIAVWSAPSVALVVLVHAAARAGAGLVLLNTRLTASEAQAQLDLVPCDRVWGAAPPLQLRARDRGPSPLTVLFTSGTTGRSKAAMLDLAQHEASAAAAAAHLGSPRDRPEVHLCGLPLFHVGGLSMIFRVAHAGGHLRLHAKFDPDAVLRELVTERVTHLSLVATTLQRVLEARGEGFIEHSLHALLIGGGPLPGPLRARAEAAGLTPLHTYGLTETASQVVTVRPADAARAGDSVGTPLPGVALRVVDDTRAEVPAGVAGEIEVRGPMVMLGYEGNPDATAATLADGWLRTRDLGTLDARGFLTVHARRSDLIKSGGENVYPAEVEAAVLGAKGVREVAVIGEPDAAWGQAPVAALVLDGGSVEAVKRHLDAVLARYKHPRRWVIAQALPRTASGKVDRAALRALLGLAD